MDQATVALDPGLDQLLRRQQARLAGRLLTAASGVGQSVAEDPIPLDAETRRAILAHVSDLPELHESDLEEAGPGDGVAGGQHSLTTDQTLALLRLQPLALLHDLAVMEGPQRERETGERLDRFFKPACWAAAVVGILAVTTAFTLPDVQPVITGNFVAGGMIGTVLTIIAIIAWTARRNYRLDALNRKWGTRVDILSAATLGRLIVELAPVTAAEEPTPAAILADLRSAVSELPHSLAGRFDHPKLVRAFRRSASTCVKTSR